MEGVKKVEEEEEDGAAWTRCIEEEEEDRRERSTRTKLDLLVTMVLFRGMYEDAKEARPWQVEWPSMHTKK